MQFGGFVPMGDVPQEVLDAQKYEYDKSIAFYHDVKDLLSNAQTHHLATLRHLFRNIASMDDEAPKYAAYLEGRMTGYLEQRGVCPSCGEDHIELDLARSDPTQQRKLQDPPADEFLHMINTLPKPASDEQLAGKGVRWDPTPDQPERVVCVGPCRGHMSWPTFEDRLADKGRCGACVNMDKWGSPDGR